MNENKGLKDVPETVHSFQLDVSGSITNRRYVGDFSCRIPTIKDQCLIAKHKAFLNGDMAEFLDAGTQNVHEMISYLRYTLTEYPKFWKESDLGYELRDPNVITSLYEKVLEFEAKWMGEIWGEKADGTEKA